MREYEITTHTGTFTVQLSDEDAAAHGLTPAEPPAEKARESVPNKSRKPANKARDEAVASAFNGD